MPLVLAIEPDQRQGTVLKRIVRDHVHADLLLVDSPDAAVAALATQIPDVILVSALLSPPDEEDLLERLRSLDGGGHIQTYTIPQFASTKADEEEASGGFFGKFRKKKSSRAGHGLRPRPVRAGSRDVRGARARAQEPERGRGGKGPSPVRPRRPGRAAR